MVQDNRAYKSEMKQLKETLGQNQKGIELYQALQREPQKLKQVMDILLAEKQASQGDPYAEYDPLVAEKFRKADSLEQKLAQLEQWKADQEKEREQSRKQSAEQNVQKLESTFDKMLIEEGILKKDGTGDTKLAKAIGKLTLTTLMEMAEDPNHPTVDEVRDAYAAVMEDLPANWKSTFKKTAAPSVPASGSRSGLPAVTGGKRTKQDRIADIMNSM